MCIDMRIRVVDNRIEHCRIDCYDDYHNDHHNDCHTDYHTDYRNYYHTDYHTDHHTDYRNYYHTDYHTDYYTDYYANYHNDYVMTTIVIAVMTIFITTVIMSQGRALTNPTLEFLGRPCETKLIKPSSGILGRWLAGWRFWRLLCFAAAMFGGCCVWRLLCLAAAMFGGCYVWRLLCLRRRPQNPTLEFLGSD